jgi:hypothetical protein
MNREYDIFCRTICHIFATPVAKRNMNGHRQKVFNENDLITKYYVIIEAYKKFKSDRFSGRRYFVKKEHIVENAGKCYFYAQVCDFNMWLKVSVRPYFLGDTL